jgi:hypothetical protein
VITKEKPMEGISSMAASKAALMVPEYMILIDELEP